MFGKIYKEAVNECTPNYDLKKALMFKAAKAKRTMPIYKYSLSAAAVIILVVSAGFAGDYFDMLSNKSIEQEVITNAGLSGEENEQGSILETEEAGFAGMVSEQENSVGDLTETPAVADTAADGRALVNSPEKESKKEQKTSADLKTVTADKTETAKATEGARPEETAEPVELIQENEVNIKSEDISEDITEETESAEQEPEFKTAVQSEMAAVEDAAVGSGEENYGVSTASETRALYMKAAEESSGGSGGGSAMKIEDYDVWNAARYAQYLGINIPEKVAGAVSDITEKEVVINGAGIPSDDTWIFNCGGVVIETTKETEKADRSGEVIEINSVKVYKDGDRYEFIYMGVYFKVTGGENSEAVIKQILS